MDLPTQCRRPPRLHTAQLSKPWTVLPTPPDLRFHAWNFQLSNTHHHLHTFTLHQSPLHQLQDIALLNQQFIRPRPSQWHPSSLLATSSATFNVAARCSPTSISRHQTTCGPLLTRTGTSAMGLLHHINGSDSLDLFILDHTTAQGVYDDTRTRT